MRLRVLSRALRLPLSSRTVTEVDSWLKVITRVQHNLPVQETPRFDFNIDLQSFQGSCFNFENHIVAFRFKTFWEVSRALGILLLCGCDKFVDNSQKLMTFSQAILGRRLFRTAVKPTFYSQFVGGETPDEIKSCVNTLTETGVQPLLASTLEDDCSGRRDEVYDSNCERIIECIDMSSNMNNRTPMAQVKISGLLPADLLRIVSEIFSTTKRKEQLIEEIASGMLGKTKMKSFEDELRLAELKALQNGIRRLRYITQEASKRNVKILIDAEYTYLNPGISLLALAMMAVFNETSPLVWNTYQCYLKDAMKNLKLEIELANKFGVSFGAKIVRGAYIAQETKRALEKNDPNPICDSYAATNENYNSVLNHMLGYISHVGEKCNIIIASHNEDSIKLAVQRMRQLNIDPKSGGVHFGQLYGMCDQITYPLASMGYSVYKSIPYGSVEEVLPYLARRATENRSVLAGSRKEKEMLWKNLKLRLFGLHRVNRFAKGDLHSS